MTSKQLRACTLLLLEHLLRRGFWAIHGAEESSGVNSSPAGAAGQVVGKT